MKKLFSLLVLLLIFSSCATTNSYIGNVTAYNDDGTILRQWENVVLKETTNGTTTSNSIKNFGLNFYDSATDNFIIVNNSVPCIIEYKVNGEVSNWKSFNKYSNEDREALVIEYKELKNELKEVKEELKKYNKNSVDYINLKSKRNAINKRMQEIETYFFNHNITYKLK